MKLKNLLAKLFCLFSLSACSLNPNLELYKNERPVFDLQKYFNGKINAWGVFQNRSGEVVKRFTVVINAQWQGDVGTLDEDFTYSDGTKQKRIWTIRKLANNQYVGTAADVIGEAKGRSSGNALFWSYTLALPVDEKIVHVQFNDWMYQIDDQVVLNRAVMSKWGFKLGEVFLSFKKEH